MLGGGEVDYYFSFTRVLFFVGFRLSILEVGRRSKVGLFRKFRFKLGGEAVA